MELSQPCQLKQTIVNGRFKEEKYRWVILIIGSCAMILNGLLNNIVIPIANKLAEVYNQSEKIINLPIVLSFLVFSLVNIPINHFIDRQGFKMGYIIGISLYLTGMFLVSLINTSFPLIIIGYIIFTFGQPFILNAPATIATYWFLPQNVQIILSKRAFATAILVGSSIIGSGLGFAIPTLVVGEDSTQQIAKNQIFSLYLGYTLAAGIFLILNFFCLKAKPSVPPSKVNKKQELSLTDTFRHIKKDKNLWKFFCCYWLIYGSFQTFASSANLLIKPFGASNLDISMAAIMLILFGTVGAVLGSFYLKKTREYRRLFRFCSLGALSLIIMLAFQLIAIDSVALIKINVGVIGFFLTPIIPTSYQIGCEISFPIGQAQVTGILNGGALIWAFISDSLLTLIIGFGSKAKSIVFISIIVLFIAVGNVLCFMVKVDLKRKQFQQSQIESESTRDSSASEKVEQSIEMGKNQLDESISTDRGSVSNDSPNYETLQEQNL